MSSWRRFIFKFNHEVPTALPLKLNSAKTKGHVTPSAWHVYDPPLMGCSDQTKMFLSRCHICGSTPCLEGPVTSCSRFRQLIDGSIKELSGTYDMLFLAPIGAQDSYRESNCSDDDCRFRRRWGPIKKTSHARNKGEINAPSSATARAYLMPY